MRDFGDTFPLPYLKKTLNKMVNFCIISKVRDKDGLYRYVVSYDLLMEDISKPVRKLTIVKKSIYDYEDFFIDYYHD